MVTSAGSGCVARLAAKQVRRRHPIMVIRATGAPQNRSSADSRACAGAGQPHRLADVLVQRHRNAAMHALSELAVVRAGQAKVPCLPGHRPVRRGHRASRRPARRGADASEVRRGVWGRADAERRPAKTDTGPDITLAGARCERRGAGGPPVPPRRAAPWRAPRVTNQPSAGASMNAKVVPDRNTTTAPAPRVLSLATRARVARLGDMPCALSAITTRAIGKLMKKISPPGSSGDQVAAERPGGDSDPAPACPGADRPAGVGGPELRQPDRQASRRQQAAPAPCRARVMIRNTTSGACSRGQGEPALPIRYQTFYAWCLADLRSQPVRQPLRS